MVVKREGNLAFVELNRHPEVNGHRPSVDVMFESVAQAYGKSAIGVILTGMGRDGATGIRQIREAGGYTVAQDERTCVVFGMPKVAIAEGGIERVCSLNNIATQVLQQLPGECT